jgi:hypothetical protein
MHLLGRPSRCNAERPAGKWRFRRRLWMNRLQQSAARVISSLGANSTNGGSVTFSDGLVTYRPATNFVGADLFAYRVSGQRSAFGLGVLPDDDSVGPRWVRQPAPSAGSGGKHPTLVLSTPDGSLRSGGVFSLRSAV